MNIYKEIIQHANELETHPLMGYFRTTKALTSQSFQFAPQMAFFVLGFKDILAEVYKPIPITTLEKDLNVHCQEDSDHWRWFLDDLEKLDKLGLIGHFGKSSSPDVLAGIWSAQGYAVRKQTYSIISLLAGEECAEKKLVIIECLESAFSTFITNLTFMTKRFGLYETLKYFGKEHHFDESQHTMGSWIGGNKEKETINLNDEENNILLVIANIFNGFHEVFDVWFAEVETVSEGVNTHYEAREEEFV